MTVSPLAPSSFPDLPPVGGVALAVHAAGLRYTARADLFMALLPESTSVAGVFTRSLCPSAPVDWCRWILPRGVARAVVCNAGNANAFTGRAGETSAKLTAEVVARAHGLAPDHIFLASTGVIGETLPDEALIEGLEAMTDMTATWREAADAIRTTDTFAKGSSASATIDGAEATVVGIAKGSGMIAPDMATMLGFVFTDAAVSAQVLQQILSSSVAKSFNRITVDSDTSTSDTVLLFATGALGNEEITSVDDPRCLALGAAVDHVTLDLAHQIVRDGEGATKFVTVHVTGAETEAAASRIALSIGNSPLVKTALAAEDANWGRIVMAVGKAGERADRDALRIHIGDELVTEAGLVAESYSEERATEHLHHDEVTLTVDVGVGDAEATIWTCDLTHGYIEINAGYRS